MAIIQAAMETICINRSDLDGLFTVFGLYIGDRGASGVLVKAFPGADSHCAERKSNKCPNGALVQWEIINSALGSGEVVRLKYVTLQKWDKDQGTVCLNKEANWF